MDRFKYHKLMILICELFIHIDIYIYIYIYIIKPYTVNETGIKTIIIDDVKKKPYMSLTSIYNI